MKSMNTPYMLLFVFFLVSIRTSFSQEVSSADTVLAIEYFEIGESFSKAAQYDSSIIYLEKAKEIYEELSKSFDQKNIWSGLIRCLNQIGRNLNSQLEYEESLEFLNKAISIGKERLGENNIEISESYHNIGHIYLEKGYYNKSLEYLQKSLAIELLFGDEQPFLASTYNSIANTYKSIGDYDKALENFQKSLSILIREYGEVNTYVFLIYNNMGEVYRMKKNFDKALEYFQKSLSFSIRLLGEDHPDLETAVCYNDIGLTNWDRGNYDEALENFQKSLSIKIRLMGENHPQVAVSYRGIGLVYWKKGKFQDAIDNYQKSLSIDKKVYPELNTNIAINYRYIAELYFTSGAIDSSLAYCQKSIISNVPKFINDSIYSNPSIYYIISESELLNSLKLKAKIFSQLSESTGITDLEMSLSTYKLAVKLIDKMRTGCKAETSKLFFGENVSEIFTQAVQTSFKLYDLTKDENYKEQAFFFIEKSKSEVLHEECAESQAKHFANLPSDLLEIEKQLRIDLAFYDTQVQNEYQKKDKKDSVKISEYWNLLFNLKTKYEELISNFEKNYPDYYNLKYLTTTISVAEIQQQLADNSILLEYFIGDSSIFIVVISKDEFEIVSVEKPADFSKIVKSFYSSMLKTEAEKYIDYANRLSEILISPILKSANNKEKLVIIPHDLLYKIPFEALFTSTQNQTQNNYSKLNYLINRYEISYHYSTKLFVNSLNPGSSTKERMKKSFTGFAPVFPEEHTEGYVLASRNVEEILIEQDENLRSSLINGAKLSELKYSKWEVETIQKLFTDLVPNNTSIAYFYSEASESSFKSKIKNFDIIHLATHSFINETHPQISAILFAQNADDSFSGNEGILYAGETYNLDLSADLVVLSSCESGLGKIVKGEGIMALTRGFLYSGAKNIIFTLWKIPDKHSSELMVEFYRQMLSGKNYSEALRLAKLSFIQNQVTARPRSWASFILIGVN